MVFHGKINGELRTYKRGVSHVSKSIEDTDKSGSKGYKLVIPRYYQALDLRVRVDTYTMVAKMSRPKGGSINEPKRDFSGNMWDFSAEWAPNMCSWAGCSSRFFYIDGH